jgi:membrane-bound lytic murein transglycosylase D
VFLVSGCQTFDVKDDAAATSNIAGHSVNPAKFSARKHLSPLLLPQDSGDVWDRIRLTMAMPIPDHRLVNQYREWFISNPQHLALISQRARPFMYLIVQELEQRDLPIELALLPIVESSFNPLAYSSANASGLWQFTSPMASHFGLDMNWWYDGRRDVPAATTAALDMLEYLYKKTDNWLYALAAYNAGEGRLRKAIRYNEARGLSTDFFALNLPTETEQYVPQFLALADVIKNADQYGINLNRIPNKPLIEVIDVGSQIDLAVAADLANMPIERLQKLNPGFNRWATSPDGPHQLIVPVSKANDFKQALADTDLDDRMKWFTYRIKAGDNISAIAKRHQTSISTIKSMNDIHGDRIIAGKFLYMPDVALASAGNTSQKADHKPDHKADHKLQVLALAQAMPNKPLKQYPPVTLVATALTPDIAPKLASLSASNIAPLLAPHLAPDGVSEISTNGKYPIEHKVKYADTLWSIARVYKVSVEQITRWNKMSDSHKLSEGKTLKIWTAAVQDKTAAVTNSLIYKMDVANYQSHTRSLTTAN